jgi:putative transposase
MAQTLVALYVHIIFSTKDRRSLIKPQMEEELYAYIGGINGNKSKLLAANGTENHTHLLVSLSKTINLSELVGDIKRDSSKWMKTKDSGLFQWQDGYGAFSVSQSHLKDVKKYIAAQKEHHARENYEDEFRCFLRRYEVPFDEEYMWG